MRIRPPTPSGIAIGVALVVVLTAGAAAGQALITSADIKDNTIQSVDIKGETIVSGDIKNETIASGDIKNGTIAGGDLKNGAVNSSKVADNSLTAADIKANGVGSSELAANAVTNAKIAGNAVNSAKVADNSLTAADLAPNSVGTSEIANGSVGEADVDPDLLAGVDTRVSELTGLWRVSNDTVSMTPDGVEFGPYANGAAEGGTIFFNGLNGMTLADVENLVYYARYTTDGDTGGVGVPSLRIFLEDAGGGPDHSAIFSPNTQAPDADIAEGPFHEWVATSGGWRYDDDARHRARCAVQRIGRRARHRSDRGYPDHNRVHSWTGSVCTPALDGGQWANLRIRWLTSCGNGAQASCPRR